VLREVGVEPQTKGGLLRRITQAPAAVPAVGSLTPSEPVPALMPSAATGTQEGEEGGRGEVLAGLSERLAHVESALSRLLGKGPAKAKGEEGGEGKPYDEAVADFPTGSGPSVGDFQGFTLHLRAMLLPMLTPRGAFYRTRRL